MRVVARDRVRSGDAASAFTMLLDGMRLAQDATRGGVPYEVHAPPALADVAPGTASLPMLLAICPGMSPSEAGRFERAEPTAAAGSQPEGG